MEILSLSYIGLILKNFGIPGILWLCISITSSPNYFFKFSSRYNQPSQAFFLSCENFIFQDKYFCSPSMTLSTNPFFYISSSASSIASGFPPLNYHLHTKSWLNSEAYLSQNFNHLLVALSGSLFIFAKWCNYSYIFHTRRIHHIYLFFQ